MNNKKELESTIRKAAISLLEIYTKETEIGESMLRKGGHAESEELRIWSKLKMINDKMLEVNQMILVNEIDQ
jgi:hypothetical protein